MIKKLTQTEIASLLEIDDKIEESYPYCDKSEWIQKLLNLSISPKTFIYGDIEDGLINSYIVAIDAVNPPLSYQVAILFFYCRNNDFQTSLKLKELLNEWAIESGAREITFLCKDLKVFEKYGAKQKGIFAGWDL